MKLDYRDHIVCIFDGDEDLSWVHEIQNSTEKNKIIYVSLEGTDDKYLHPDRFIVKNYSASLTNHFMWDGILTSEEHDRRMFEMVDEYIDKGKQFTIENYEFVEDEPFYDYSGGREE